MAMDLFSVIGFALTAAALAVLLRNYRPEFGLLVGLCAGIMILLAVITAAAPVFAQLQSLMQKAHVSSQYAAILLKALGICFITQLACDCCVDAGETAIASKLELAGKIAVLLVSLPLFTQIANLAVGLID